MVTDLYLSRRLERTEGRGAASHAEAHRSLVSQYGSEWREIGGAIAVYDGPESPVTQTFGLGLFEIPTRRILDDIELFFQDRGAPVYHETSPLADKSLWPLIGERRYAPVEFSTVMCRTPGPAPQASSAVASRVIPAGEADLWAAVAVEGWRGEAGLDDQLVEILRIASAKKGAVLFLAELDGRPIAAGALNIFDGVALLAGACTIPDARGQGAQASLLAARLAYAADAGCDLAMMVAEAGSASQRNAERAGFRIAYTRIKWRLG